jgi:Histidine kinase
VAGADAAATEEVSDVVLEIAFVAPWAVGVALGQTLQRTRTLAAEAERARLEQELETERAAAAERRRIARELHDVLANSLSVMIVQASLAADLATDDPGAAAAAVAEVERSGAGPPSARPAGCSGSSRTTRPASIRSMASRTFPSWRTSTGAPASRSSSTSTTSPLTCPSASSFRPTGSCRRR